MAEKRAEKPKFSCPSGVQILEKPLETPKSRPASFHPPKTGFKGNIFCKMAGNARSQNTGLQPQDTVPLCVRYLQSDAVLRRNPFCAGRRSDAAAVDSAAPAAGSDSAAPAVGADSAAGADSAGADSDPPAASADSDPVLPPDPDLSEIYVLS